MSLWTAVVLTSQDNYASWIMSRVNWFYFIWLGWFSKDKFFQVELGKIKNKKQKHTQNHHLNFASNF